MVDWVAVVLNHLRESTESRTESLTPTYARDPIAGLLLNNSFTGKALSGPAPASDGQCYRLSIAVPGQPDANFQAADLVERFCIQTVDGGLTDGEAIECIVTWILPTSYDTIPAEAATIHISTSEDHGEVVDRWLEIRRVQFRYIKEMLELVAKQ